MFAGLLSEEVVKGSLHKYFPLPNQLFSFEGLLSRLREMGYYQNKDRSQYLVLSLFAVNW
jgi:hypothetical protein